MALARRARFALKSRIVSELYDDDDGWSLRRINLLLVEFGFDSLDGNWNGPDFQDTIANIADADLLEMYTIVVGTEPESIENEIDAVELGNWKSGYVRLFVSHSAKHKKFVGEVADELAVVGVHGFVAHDTMEYSRPWQAQIEQALRSMQAFVAVVHPEFNDSAWCHQEAGWALGRDVPRYVVRMGVDPAGFVGHDQWPSGVDSSSKQVADVIARWVFSIPDFSDKMTDGLFSALASAGNYMDAGATAQRIGNLSGLSDAQFERLNEIWWSNDQLYTGVLPTKALKPFYQSNGREWPPSRPELPRPESVAFTDAPPF
jgi:hypothetical protein